MRTRLAVGLLLGALSVASPAQIQRLIIPQANVKILPGSSALLPTLCTDYGIRGPSQNQVYGHVLTSADSARVIIGAKEMSLADAVRANKIRLVTPRPSIDDFIEEQRHFTTLDPTETIDLGQMRKKLLGLPPSKRAEFLSRAQNASNLRIENLSGQRITFIANNAAVGTVDAPPPAIPQNVTKQTNFWTAQVQQQLQNRGYSVTADGEVGSATKEALLSFQKKYNLKQTGTPTQGVVQTLRRLDGEEWLHRVPSGKYMVARLDQILSEKTPFYLTTSDGAVKYEGAKPDELIASLLEITHQSGEDGKDLYLELTGFDEREKTKLLRSLQLVNDESNIVLMPSPEESLIFRDTYFRKGARFHSVELENKIETSGRLQGWFHSIVSFLVNLHGRVTAVTVDIWTRTKAQMQLVLNTFRMNGAATPALEMSIADVVSRSQERLIAAGYSRKNLRTQLRDGTKRYWAELEELRLITPWWKHDSAC